MLQPLQWGGRASQELFSICLLSSENSWELTVLRSSHPLSNLLERAQWVKMLNGRGNDEQMQLLLKF